MDYIVLECLIRLYNIVESSLSVSLGKVTVSHAIFLQIAGLIMNVVCLLNQGS